MSDAAEEAPEQPEKSSKLPLLIGGVLAILGAAGGYFAVSSGLGGSPATEEAQEAASEAPDALPDVAFVEVEPIVISLVASNNIGHLRFRANLEVEAAYRKDVEHVLPRVTDVMNGYLRALDVKDLKDPMALIRLRSQMLRRVQLVVGDGRVRDLLIMEFVLS